MLNYFSQPYIFLKKLTLFRFHSILFDFNRFYSNIFDFNRLFLFLMKIKLFDFNRFYSILNRMRIDWSFSYSNENRLAFSHLIIQSIRKISFDFEWVRALDGTKNNLYWYSGCWFYCIEDAGFMVFRMLWNTTGDAVNATEDADLSELKMLL